jgi:hypothetical protein
MQWSQLARRAAAATAVVGLTIGSIGGIATPAFAARTTKAKALKAPATATTFTAAGHVTAVGTDTLTVTLDVKGGNQKLKGQSLTVSVPSTARVTREGVAATLADVQAGDHVAIQGTKSGTTYTAVKVHVDTPA